MNKRILITTGLSYSDVGGPAQYSSMLKQEFERLGYSVRIAQYSSIESALLQIWPNAWWANCIIALDAFSVGVPSVLAAWLFGKRIIVRIGGDFLWESYVERTGEKITLKQFNYSIPKLSAKERLIFHLTKFLTRNATRLAFNTEWQRGIWQKTYNVSHVKSCVIRNYIPERNFSQENNKNFIW